MRRKQSKVLPNLIRLEEIFSTCYRESEIYIFLFQNRRFSEKDEDQSWDQKAVWELYKDGDNYGLGPIGFKPRPNNQSAPTATSDV